MGSHSPATGGGGQCGIGQEDGLGSDKDEDTLAVVHVFDDRWPSVLFIRKSSSVQAGAGDTLE